MPALDIYQRQLVTALRKAGWDVSPKPYRLDLGKRTLYVDATAQRSGSSGQQIIIVEIKGMQQRSAVRSLEEAVGQYVIYRALFEEKKIKSPLYLAVPTSAYEGILSEPIGEVVRRRVKVKLIVFDVYQESISKWID